MDMRRRLVGLVTGVVMFAVLGLLVLNGPAAAAPGDPGSSFFAYIDGNNEVPPTATDVTGTASFRVREDGSALEYSILVYNISNVTMGHIHLGRPGQAGPIVLTLIPMQAPNSGLQSIVITGAATAAQLEGPLKGQPLSALTSQMASNAYVNFHTSNGSATPGIGNYPAGEARGNITSSDANRLGTQPAVPTQVNIAPAGPTVQPFGPANNIPAVAIPLVPSSPSASLPPALLRANRSTCKPAPRLASARLAPRASRVVGGVGRPMTGGTGTNGVVGGGGGPGGMIGGSSVVGRPQRWWCSEWRTPDGWQRLR